MQSCEWYLAIPGTTRTVIVPVLAPAPDAAFSSLAGLVLAAVVLAAVVLAGGVLAWLVLADDVVLGSPPVLAGLAESAGVSLGTVVSAGLGPACVAGGVTGGVAGADTVALAAVGVSPAGFVAGVAGLLRISVGRSAARGGAARDSLALGSARADSALGAAGRGVAASG